MTIRLVPCFPRGYRRNLVASSNTRAAVSANFIVCFSASRALRRDSRRVAIRLLPAACCPDSELFLERPHVEFHRPRARIPMSHVPVSLCDRVGLEQVLSLNLRQPL